MLSAKYLGAVAKGEMRMAHLAFSLLVIGAAAAAVQVSVLKAFSFLAVAAIFFASWMAYSAAAAAFFGRDGFGRGFGGALHKTLFLDSLTYLPMLLPLIAKIATAAAGIDTGRYGNLGNIPVAMAFGIAIAANIAGKAVLFPKSLEETLNSETIKKIIGLAVVASVVSYFLFFSIVSVMKHNSFNTTAFDLAIFDQTMWGYSQGYGPGFFNTVRGLVLLGDHLHPILFIFSPLYKLLPMPDALLVLQSLALALGAFPVYWLAKKRLNAAAAAVIAFSYLLYPSLQYMNLFDFHPEALATPLLLFAIYFVEARKYLPAAAMLVLTGMSKEHLPLALVAFGAYIFVLQKKKFIGSAMAAAGIAWLALNFGVLLPHFSSGQGYGYVSWYSYLGNSLPEAARNAILHPQLLIGRLLSADTFSYAALLLLPLGGAAVALLGFPYLLLGAPFFTINFLRGQDITTALIYQYNAELIPFLYMATIAGAQRLAKLPAMLKLYNSRVAVSAFVLVSTIAAAFAYGPFSTLYDVKDFAPSQHAAVGNKLLKEIPDAASVSADPQMLPHLAHRKEAYMFPNPFIRLMFGKGNGTAGNNSDYGSGTGDVEYVIMDLSMAGPTYNAEQYTAFVAKFLDNSNYGLVALEDSYALFKKGSSYGEGLCRLDSYFKTSTAAAVRVDLGKALGDKGRTLLKQC
ncbi:DUF2079 domain-containing protein [Candidatus Woesearchaeota archaeon]|nr:DUF2079 domain-containing protein [Candidatus Woesearchaeota archaeon]